jgi:hypothetical protein
VKGANAIYIYDHGSRKPMYYDLEDWIMAGVVQYSYFKFKNHERYRRGPFAKTAQGAGFQDCFQRAAGKHQWLAFFDIDEFLVRCAARLLGAASCPSFFPETVNWRPALAHAWSTWQRRCTVQCWH